MKKRLLLVLCTAALVLGLTACGEYKRVDVKKTEDDTYIGPVVTVKSPDGVYKLDENGDLLATDDSYDEIVIRDIFTNEITYYAPRKNESSYSRALYDAKGNKVADYGKYTYGEYSIDGCVLRAKATSNKVQIKNVGAALWNPKDDVVVEYSIFSLKKLNDSRVLAIDNDRKVMGVIDSSAEKVMGFPMDVDCYEPQVRNGYVAGMSESLSVLEEEEQQQMEEQENAGVEDNVSVEDPDEIEDEGPEAVVTNLFDKDFNLITSIENEESVDLENPTIRGDYFLVMGLDDFRICNLKDGESVFESEYGIHYFDGNVMLIDDNEKVYVADKNGEPKSEGYDDIVSNINQLESLDKKADFFIAKDKNKLVKLSTSGSVKEEIEYAGIYGFEGYGDYIVVRGRDENDEKIAGIINSDLKEILPIEKYTKIIPLKAVYGDDAPEDYFYCRYLNDDGQERGTVIKADGKILVEDIVTFVPVKEKYFALLTGEGSIGFMNYEGNWEAQNQIDEQ